MNCAHFDFSSVLDIHFGIPTVFFALRASRKKDHRGDRMLIDYREASVGAVELSE